MRVVIVRRVAGATFSLDEYADRLVEALRVIRPSWEILEAAPVPWNIPDKLWMSGSGFKKYYETFWRFPRAVSLLKADVFHVIDQCESHIVYPLHRQKKAVVATCHDLVQFIYPEILQEQSRWPALSLAIWKYSVSGLKKVNRVIAVSNNTAQDTNKFLNIDSTKIDVIYNGVSSDFRVLPELEVIKVRQELAISSNALCLLNVGSTHQRKNIMAVLQVLKNLREKKYPVLLWRTGSRFSQEQSEFIEEHLLESCIIDFGNPSQEELVKIYNAADILLAPSIYEGFGLTVLEAMACGTPVVTSNVSSIPEVTGDAGIMVNPNSVEDIEEAVMTLYKDSALKSQLIEKGLLRVKSFTWANTAQQVALVYEEIYQKKK